jgi:hypothetical protein
MSRFGRRVRQAAAALLSIAALAGSYAARADQILSASHLVTGTSAISDVGYSFTVSGPGTLDISLQDLSWPTSSLTDLSFSAATPASVIGEFNGAGTGSYKITGAGTIYAYVTGEATDPATGPAYGLGLYTLKIDFTPSAVPLPGTFGLLLVALLGFAVLQRQNLKAALFPSAHPLRV